MRSYEYERFAPVKYVQIDGKRLSDELAQRLLQLEFEEDDEKVPKVTLRFNNEDLEITDSLELAMGQRLQVQWGFIGGRMSERLSFTIKARRGFRVRELIGYNDGNRMVGESTSFVWKNVKYSDIASRIAEKRGLKSVARDSEIVHEQVAQSNQSDLNFLKELAEKIGYACYVEGDELHFHPRDYGAKPSMAFAYYNGEYGNLISFEPEEKTLDEPDEVAVAGVDPMEKEPSYGKANDANTERDSLAEGSFLVNAASGVMTAVSGAVENVGRLLHLPGQTGKTEAAAAQTDAEAQQEAEAAFRKAEDNTVEATITTVGTPSLRAKRIITLYGLGKTYSGNWYVKQATHSVGASYICTAKLTRNATGNAAAAGAGKTSGNVNKDKAEPEAEATYTASAETGSWSK